MENISTQLASLAITRSLILQRVANNLSKEVAQAYLSVIDDVTKQLKSGDDINIKNVNKIIKELQSRMEVNLDIESDLTKLGMSEAQWAQSSVNGAVGIDLMSKLPTEATIAKIVGDSYIEGATINEWFNGVNDSMKNDLKKSVRVGMLEGETTIQIAKRVRDSLGVSLNHADSISRTAVATVSNNARMATYEANDDVIKGWEHLSALDNRTSQVCATRDGATWDLEHKGLNDKGKKFEFRKPPLHFRCLTGDTLISTRYPISYISKRKYEGVIYTISTSAGNSIRCTPNHPILTDRGFVEAQFLNKLDKIATDCVGEGLRVLDNQDKKGVSTIENLFSSIGESFGVLPVKMPVSPEDFHSDVTDNEVDVIFIDRELWLERYAMLNKVLTDSSFVNTNPSISYISSLNKGFMRLRNSFSGIVTIFNLIKSSLFVHNRPLNKLLLGLCSRFNALSDKLGLNKTKWNIKPTSNTSESDSIIIESNSTLESKHSISPFISIFGKSTSLSNNSNNDFVSDSKLSRNITDGSIGDKVFFDDIVDIVSAECVTHVYNLENDMGYYTANNLITHNCRSLLSPLLRSYEELGLMGIDIPEGTRSAMDGSVSSSTTFERWFESKDSKFQEKYLGKQRYEMFKAGKITFNDLVGQNGMTLTIKELGMIDKGVATLKFVGAKTLQEAEKRIMDIGIKHVSLKGLDLDGSNAVLKAIESENNKRPISLNIVEATARGKTAKATYSNTHKSITVNSKLIGGTATNEVVKSYEDRIIEQQEVLKDYKDKYLNNNRYDQKQVKKSIRAINNYISDIEYKIEKGEIALPHSISSEYGIDKNESIYRTIIHEIGHHRHYELFGANDTRFKFDTTASVSEYGKVNNKEYFAEMYVSYRIHGDKNIPQDLIKLFKEIDNE